MSQNFELEMTVHDSFDGDMTYTLLRKIGPDREIQYRIQLVDSRHYRHLPALSGAKEWLVDSDQVEQLFKELEQAQISIAPEFVAGVDGSTTTVKITRGFNLAEFTWWEDLPDQWERLRIIPEFFESHSRNDS
ncbi:MAG: hypothetical protein KOO60_14415 [Gemmatimonadales bacterium]|nr:hypothetical protein [Gemmatimonadales bacterium]